MKKIFIIPVLVLCVNIFAQNYIMVHKELKETSKKLNYEFVITYPVISIGDKNITLSRLFNEHMEKKAGAMRDTFRVWMQDWDTISNAKDMQSYYESGDSVFYAKDKIISILFYEGYYFAGAAHPNNSSYSVNYNMETGKEFTLSDILLPGWETEISRICIADITKQKQSFGIEPAEWVQEGAGPKAENFAVFNITNDHLLITFPTYQVGSYAEGPSEVEIPYVDIKQFINKSGLLGGLVR
jgi:hypothetical protein